MYQWRVSIPPSDIRSARMRRDSDRNYVGKSRPESRAKTRERVLNGKKKIEDGTLVALTIMIAESRPEEKEMMISVIMNCMQ